MPTLLYKARPDSVPAWRAAFAEVMPELEFRAFPDLGSPDDVDYALVWRPPGDVFTRLPKLRAVFSLGAGIDHLRGAELPSGIPVVRMVDPALTAGMVEYALWHVLRLHRGGPEYEAQQRRAHWKPLPSVLPGDRPIGVLGLGEIGGAVARALAALGFPVTGWSRTARNIPGVQCHHGRETLSPVLASSDIVVCLLPHTSDTDALLDARAFAAMPAGASVINAARGKLLVEHDLLAALDGGHLRHAVLDVFEREPLPADHPLWSHPGVTLTPHVASQTDPRSAARSVCAQIRRHLRGEPLQHVVDFTHGY